ncbi:MAG: transaldolase, partial [Pyrinomonadaceae bacterium]
MNHLKELKNCGQSIWLDFIERSLLTSGDLKKLIEEDGVSGMTSNPAIFEKAITGSNDYDDDLQKLTEDKSLDAKSIYEHLAIKDIQDAADTLHGVYTVTKARDGYVSLEVSPALARDTEKTLEEARRLWKTVNRENLMIKVPGTPEGIPAVRQLISEGININITLLFALSAYEQVVEAYLQGLEERVKRDEDISRMASVASFFVSRIDTMIDNELESRIADFEAAGEIAKANTARGLRGRIAIANAKLAYQYYLTVSSGPRWDALKSCGAHTQRLL